MARGARLVDARGIVQDSRQFVLAQGGVAKSIERAMIAQAGEVCQFWPPDEGEGGQNPIVMTDAEALSYDIKAPTAGQPQAKCYYDCNTGNLILSDPEGDYTIPVLAPVPRGTGQYLCKFEPVSGSFVTHFDGYNPNLMDYDGATGYYNKTYTSSGNKVTVVARFTCASFSGGTVQRQIIRVQGAVGRARAAVLISSSDYAATPEFRNKIRFAAESAAGAIICRLISTVSITDGAEHMIFATFDADTGTASLYVDGVNVDDIGNPSRVAPTAAALDTGSTACFVGANNIPGYFFSDRLGYIGFADVGGLNWSDFMSGNRPLLPDETTWSQWGGVQPRLWHSIGKMENNLGSAGAMTKTGTIVQVASTVDMDWHDVLEQGNLAVFVNYLPNTTSVPGQVLGEAVFSVAADDGTGAPEVVTQVDKTINFIAERTGNNLILTQAPWTLTDNQVNEVARARVDIDNDGVLRGFEHNIEVRTETYALNWNSGFTVQADLVAGSVSGTALGIPLSTAVKRTWEVAAGVGDSNTGTIDLTVTDGVNSVTKRIILNAASTEETSPSDLSDDWTTFLRIIDEHTTYSGLDAEAGGRLIFYPDGTMDAFTYRPPTHYPFGLPGYPLNWSVAAPTLPDPENFEIMVTRLAGDAPVGPLDVWLNLSSQREWHIDTFAKANLPFETVVDEANGAFLVSIREVGRPDTVKLKTVEIIATATSNGTGISIP